MGLRLREGIDLQRYAALGGAPLQARRIKAMEDLGMVESAKNRLRTTAAGRLLLNQVIAQLAA